MKFFVHYNINLDHLEAEIMNFFVRILHVKAHVKVSKSLNER